MVVFNLHHFLLFYLLSDINPLHFLYSFPFVNLSSAVDVIFLASFTPISFCIFIQGNLLCSVTLLLSFFFICPFLYFWDFGLLYLPTYM